MLTTLFSPITDRESRPSWLWASAGAALFAAGLPIFVVSHAAGFALLLGLLPAITIPALRTGWRGALMGLFLLLIAFELGLSAIVVFGERPDLDPFRLAALLVVVLSTTLLAGVAGETRRRRRETATVAARAEDRLNHIIDTMPTGCLVLDPGGRVVRSNREARLLLSTHAPEEFDLFLQDLIAPEAWPEVCGRLLDPIGGHPIKVLIPGERPHRTEWVFGTFRDGGQRQILAFFWDAEEKCGREEETRSLLAAVRSLEEGVVLSDLTGAIRYVNAAAVSICGVTDRSALLGSPLREHPLGPDVEVSTTPVVVDGAPTGTVAILRDLSAQRMVARKAAVADKQATLGRLVAGAAHEINNPLTAVLANLEVLRTLPRLPKEAAALVELILREGNRAGGAVRGLLDFARQRPTKRVTVGLAEVVQRAVAMREAYARCAGIELTFHAPVHPSVQVDLDQVEQVIVNLLLNAEQAVAGRAVRRIDVTIGARGGQALLVVNDSGPGVPAGLAEKIFEPFYTTKGAHDAPGLGLAVSAGIIAEHGGAIGVARGVLGGAQFTVTFPEVAGTEAAPAPAKVIEDGVVAGLSVLLVDDEPAILSSVGRVLERLGHSVRTAATGEEAIEIAQEEPVDVIISDLRMPGLSGRELYAKLVAAGVVPKADFIVATGDIADPLAIDFLQATGVPVILKPFEIRSLVETLSRTRPTSKQVERVLERAG
ncbi:MAG TPA: response regulator [Gemmatimonadales bacterium]|nr:response regulator [Gemmatimonadales bacterium]